MMNIDKSEFLLYTGIILQDGGNGKVICMGFEKKDDKKDRGSGFQLSSLLPKRPEPEWDDGTDNQKPDGLVVRNKTLSVVMVIYGIMTGFVGCQYCKYLHQRFACYAWGVELTSRPIKSYGVPNIIVDIVAVFLVYALIGAVGILLNRGLKVVMNAHEKEDRDVFNEALGYGFLALVIVSLIMLFLPVNMFLIGID